MTTNQLIALLFPLGTAAACGLFALGTVKWLNRKYPATASPTTRTSPSEPVEEEFTNYASSDDLRRNRIPPAVGDADRAILDALTAPDESDERLVLSPQARHRLHEEMVRDLEAVEKILGKVRLRERRLHSLEDAIQSSNGGNF
ncbi:hypothetical protein IVB12_15830 [Bradyrhizobium sp. 179]|uniref:hypothetical protein n=1 Tax=Bradyrhizobium sp. 179 TaxID=2782648 RepID=UPI001FFAF1DD|nr:hypothetical protein [Bradyrhizobium sp. 179]MCK1543386.1 hypothetical protein [Bradyrhizobium sp. 179]